jgi:NAD(P)H dehydrogenase (quinone)
VFQFPLWWLGMPAIMKGWIERVFAVGQAYGDGRWFDRGWLAGKRALCSITVGGSNAAYSESGMCGELLPLLRPIHHGTLVSSGWLVQFEQRQAPAQACSGRALTVALQIRSLC